MITGMNLFSEEGIPTTTFEIERDKNELRLIPAGVQGIRGQRIGRDPRKVVTLSTVNLPQSDFLKASEVQNVRAFGKTSELEQLQTLVNKILLKGRERLDATIEWHMLGAIKGKILDADGTSVLLDCFDRFQMTQVTQSLGTASPSTDIADKFLEALNKLDDELAGKSYTSAVLILHRNDFRKVVTHPSVQRAYKDFQAGAFLRNDPRAGFPFQDVLIKQYRGKVNGMEFMTEGEGYLVPLGVPDMFQIKYSPAQYMETVNTPGVPYYAKQVVEKFDTGIDFDMQSNVMVFNSQPNGVLLINV
jgi:hypothetical protein